MDSATRIITEILNYKSLIGAMETAIVLSGLIIIITIMMITIRRLQKSIALLTLEIIQLHEDIDSSHTLLPDDIAKIQSMNQAREQLNQAREQLNQARDQMIRGLDQMKSMSADHKKILAFIPTLNWCAHQVRRLTSVDEKPSIDMADGFRSKSIAPTPANSPQPKISRSWDSVSAKPSRSDVPDWRTKVPRSEEDIQYGVGTAKEELERSDNSTERHASPITPPRHRGGH